MWLRVGHLDHPSPTVSRGTAGTAMPYRGGYGDWFGGRGFWVGD